MSKKTASKTKLARISAALCAFAIAVAVPYSNFYHPILPDAAEANESAEQLFPFLRYSHSYQEWNDTYTIAIEECDTNYIGNLVIPQYIDGMEVTEIHSNAFEGCMNLTGVDIPKSVERIGERAFADCFSLKSVIVRNEMCMFPVSDDVFTGDDLFSGNNKFTGTICSYAESTASEYAQRSGLNFSTDMPELEASPESILPYLTYNVEGSAVIITKCNPVAYGKFMIPQYIDGIPVMEIAENAFAGCTDITEIEMPDTLQVIGFDAFSGCSGLRKIDLPEYVGTVRQNAFAECASLETVIIRGSQCNLYDSPETICNTLTPIDFPGTIFFGTIYAPAGSRAEEYANHFNVNFSTEIPEEPSYGENALPYLTYEELGEYDVRITKCSPDASGKLVIPLTINGKYVSEIAEEAFAECGNIVEIEIPPSIIIIEQGTFRDCTGLKKIDLGRRIREVESFAFAGCTSLETVIIRNEECIISQGFETFGTYDHPFTGTIYGSADSTAQEYAESNGFNFSTEMPDCTHLTVEDGSCLTFENDEHGAILTKCDASAVGKLTIPKVANGMPVDRIAENAFEDCMNLTSVALPEYVLDLPARVFGKCESLCEVILPEHIFDIGREAFIECVNLKKINLPESLEYIDDNAFSTCLSLEEITIPERVKEITTGMFSYCESLKTVNLGENITDISVGAFENCRSLESIRLPESLKTIGYNAFGHCTALKNVEIPAGLDTIEGSAFAYSGITSAVIPANVLTIPRYAFNNCEGLEKITILNPYCDIYDSGETICSSVNRTDAASFTGVICGYDGSTAEKYAEKYGYTFESLGAAPAGVRGDANADGKLDIADIVILEKWLLGSGKLTAAKNVDLCKDGTIDAYDMCLLREELVAADS